MPAITFSGLSSGLDTSSWIDAFVSVKQMTVTSLQSNLKATQTKQSNLTSLQATFTSLRSSIEKITDSKFGGSMDIFAANSAISSDEKIFTASATKSATRQTYSIKVEQLATKSSASSDRGVGAIANDETKLSDLGITKGNFTVYVNGTKNEINVEDGNTIKDLKTNLSSAGVGVEINNEGFLNLTAKNSSDKVLIGATNDTSNIKSLLGLEQQEDGSYKSSTPMFRVNTTSKLTEENLFSTGKLDDEGNQINTTITIGDFTIGNAKFTIDENTTISNLISKINANDDAGVTAYWDTTNSKMVLTSKIDGKSYINIEAGTSNFTDVMGFTETTRNEDGSIAQSKLLTDNQDLGENAILYINGTKVVSPTNTVSSDVSRLNGVTLTLKDVTPEDAPTSTLRIEQNTSDVESVLNDFINNYNKVISELDKLTKSGANFATDTTLKQIKQSLRRLITSTNGNKEDKYSLLSQIGVSTAAAGASMNEDTSSLSLDKNKLKQALDEDPDSVKKLLIGTTSNEEGAFSKIGSIVSGSLSTTGYFTTISSTISEEIKRCNDKIETETARVEAYRASMNAKFQAMEKTISAMQDSYKSLLTQ